MYLTRKKRRRDRGTEYKPKKMNPNMLPSHAPIGSAFAVLLIIVVLVIVLSGRSRKLGSGMSVLVLRRFAVSDDPQQETLVWITGDRKSVV